MTPRTHRLLVATTLLTAALTLGLAGSASASPPSPVEPAVLDFEPGVACDFPLRVSSTSGQLRTREFVDGSGNTVRLIQVGTGVSYTYTNLTTGVSITMKAHGSAIQTRVADSVGTVTANGENTLILYPSDVPAGPSTTVYQGRVVYTIDLTTGVFTLVSTSGTALDICGALA
jgi:hypothetical protein